MSLAAQDKSRGPMFALLLLAITVASAAAMRGVFNPMQEIALRDLGFTDFQLSLIQGVAASIPIALLAIPVGRITDRGNRALLLFCLSLVWTIGTAWTVFADGFWPLFGARMLAGAGALCSLTVAISIAADLSPPEKRGRFMLLLSLGNITGAAAAFALGGTLLGYFATAGAPQLLPSMTLAPWRSVHLVFALTSAALTFLLLFLREPARREVSGASNASLGAALRAIWERRALLVPLFLGQVTVIMADAGATIWAASVLMRKYQLSPDQFAPWMGGVLLCSGLAGVVIGGLAADHGQKKNGRRGLLGGAVVAAFVSIPGALFPLAPTPLGFGLLLALLLVCGAITGVITTTAIAVFVPNEIRGVCVSTFIVIGAILGFGLAPTVVTLLSQVFDGPLALGYGLAMTSGLTSIAAAVGFYVARAQSPDAQTSADGRPRP